MPIVQDQRAFAMKHGKRFISMHLHWQMARKAGITMVGLIPNIKVWQFVHNYRVGI